MKVLDKDAIWFILTNIIPNMFRFSENAEFVHTPCRGPTEDIIHYFTLMSPELHYLDIIPKIENLH